MKARRLKELLSKISDDDEILLDDFYGDGEFEVNAEIIERSIHHLSIESANVESWERNNKAHIITIGCRE